MPPARRPKLLLIDDIPEFLQEMEGLLSRAYRVTTAVSPIAGAELAGKGGFDLIITTLVMAELDGFEVIRRIRGQGITAPLIMITRHGTAQTAIEAIRLGATDYLTKPVEPEELLARVRRAIAEETAENAAFQTRSPVMLELLRLVRRVAASDARVLITGETGTGKELIARMLHQQSPRSDAPFVPVNCAAIPSELIESELFGHEQGAFTGAHKRRIGRFEEAGGGTLFLDEIGELGIAMQSKLLRAIQEGEFQRVGGSKLIRPGARIIAATNRDLRTEVREGRFREDLYFRLNVVELRIPPLRERREDIRFLGGRFIRRFAASPKAAIALSEEAWRVMEAYDWPGNARELLHQMERLSVLYAGQQIAPGHLSSLCASSLPPPGETYAEALLDFQRRYFRESLAASRGNLAQAARLAGMDKSQYHRMIVRLGLYVPSRG